MLLVIIIVIFILCIASLCTTSRRRVRQGREPIYGTAWMVPPSYGQSQQQYAGAAPPYQPGGDRYDADGNWIGDNYQNSYGQQQNSYVQQQNSYGQQQSSYGQQNDSYGQHQNYAPPPGPPPGPSPPQYGGSSYEMGSYPQQPTPAATKQ